MLESNSGPYTAYTATTSNCILSLLGALFCLFVLIFWACFFFLQCSQYTCIKVCMSDIKYTVLVEFDFQGKTVGVFVKDNFQGQFLDEWKKVFESESFEKVGNSIYSISSHKCSA